MHRGTMLTQCRIIFYPRMCPLPNICFWRLLSCFSPDLTLLDNRPEFVLDSDVPGQQRQRLRNPESGSRVNEYIKYIYTTQQPVQLCLHPGEDHYRCYTLRIPVIKQNMNGKMVPLHSHGKLINLRQKQFLSPAGKYKSTC